MPSGLHISDQELLQFADGEISSRSSATVRAHLASCLDCRKRMSELEATMTEFVKLHRQGFDHRLPSADGPAALLKLTLSAAARLPPNRPKVFASYAVLTVSAAVLLLLGRHWTAVEASPVPRTDLTPGVAIAITRGEACRAEASHFNRDVPAALQEAVFKEYGISDARPHAYEVDYLITPELGGANDIRNLWPEPYYTSAWNAHVKDALEDRLHEMVCSGQLDLATAQRELSTDWIAAYKKYFHTNRPLPAFAR